MAAYGVFNGSYIETEECFPEGQKLLLIPVEGRGKPNEEKKRLIDKLYGCIPDSGYSYEELKRERRERL